MDEASAGLMASEDFQLLQIRFEEAAIFLAEGFNNVKFDFHPTSLEGLRAYKRAHDPVLNAVDLVAALVLLSLAAVEQPAISHPLGVLSLAAHEWLEMVLQAVLAVRVFVLASWLSWPRFFAQPRNSLRVVILVGMFLESLAVMIRGRDHGRIMRLLRPYFVIDSHYSALMRRVLRQIVLSLPPILDMLLLFLVFITMAAVMGFYMFSHNTEDLGFRTLQDAFVSLFILVTTVSIAARAPRPLGARFMLRRSRRWVLQANYPDVQMPALSKSRWYFLYFLAYLLIALYFLHNLLVAVVYDTFRKQEQDKFRKLHLHRREAIRQARSTVAPKFSAPHCSSPGRLPRTG
jgi:two pore calcium channel protein 1